MAKNLPMKKTIIATLVVASVASLSLIAGNGVADTVSSVTKLNTVATGSITTASNSNNSNSNNSSTTVSSVSSANAVAVGPVAVTKVSVSNIGQPLKATVYLNKNIASASFANGSMTNDSGISLSTEKFNDKQVIVLKTSSAYNEAIAHVSLSVTDLEGKVSHLSVTIAPAIPVSAPVAQAAPIVTNNVNDNDESTDVHVVHKKKHKKEIVSNSVSSTTNSSNSNFNSSDSSSTGLSADAAFVYKKLQAQQEKTVELAKQYQDTLNQQLNLLQKQKKDLTNQEQAVDSKITDLQQKIQDANTNLGHILNNNTVLTNAVNNSNNTNNTLAPTTSTSTNSNINNNNNVAPNLPAVSTSSNANNGTNNSIAPTITVPSTPTSASAVSGNVNKTSTTSATKHDVSENKKPEFNVVLPVTPSSSTANISDKALLEGSASAVKLSEKDKTTINQGLNLPATSTSMADMVASQVNAASAPVAASTSNSNSTNTATATTTTTTTVATPASSASAPLVASEASGVLASSEAKPKHPIKKHHVAQPKPVVEDKSIIDTIIQGVMDNGLYIGVAVVVIALLGLLGVVRKKANKSNIS